MSHHNVHHDYESTLNSLGIELPTEEELKNTALAQLQMLLKGGGDPGVKLLHAMYVLLPQVLNEREERIRDLAELLDNLSIVSNWISKAQSGFNETHGNDWDPTEVGEAFGAVGYLIEWMEQSGLFDSSVVESMKAAYKQINPDGTNQYGIGASWSRAWKAADESGAGSASALKLKGILDGFNKLSQITSSISSRTQAETGFETEQYKQIQAMFKDILGSVKDSVQSFIDGAKRQG